MTGCTSLTEQAQDSVTQTLPRVGTLDFRDLQQHPRTVVCGEYKSTRRWGRPYSHAGPDFAGTRQPPTLMTPGTDGEPGGEGAAADISLQHLYYLQHILGV